MTTYTTAQYIAKIRAKVEELKKVNLPLKRAAATTHAHQMERIFEKGKASDNSGIGSYSTKTMLATRDQFTLKKNAFKPTIIKSTELKFTKSGKIRKTGKGKSRQVWIKFKKAKKAVPVMILEGGYKEFRKLNNRQNGFVDLKFTGDLQKDFSNSLRPLDKKYIAGPKREINLKKLEGMEKKYGKIGALTKDERRLFINTLQFELSSFLKK